MLPKLDTSHRALFVDAMIGYIILIVSRNPSLSYFACFVVAGGIYPLICQ